MNKSTHFELNLVEGTDLVNPLVQDVPNYQIIDEQMYKNQNAGVSGAVEIKTGTVHAINRLVPDCPMFRFTATSDYNVGDTFTVDGIQVSAKLSNGENLSDRCYVTNAEVIGVLVGTLITFFIPDVGVAKDSERLGGELPAYYAKKTEVDQAQLLAESAADLSQNNQNSINKLNSDKVSYPNYDNYITFPNDEFVAPYDGFVQLGRSTSRSQINDIIIDGNVVYTQYVLGISEYEFSPLIPCKEGDSIVINADKKSAGGGLMIQRRYYKTRN